MAGSAHIPSTRERAIRYLIEASDLEIEATEVTDATSLREDLEIGSLQALTLVMDLEEEFGIVVEDDEFESLQTVGDVIKLLEPKR
ncbi:MAG: acyl carrier protein [bacterium]|nr:acyl carrier protein [bacterium]